MIILRRGHNAPEDIIIRIHGDKDGLKRLLLKFAQNLFGSDDPFVRHAQRFAQPQKPPSSCLLPLKKREKKRAL